METGYCNWHQAFTLTTHHLLDIRNSYMMHREAAYRMTTLVTHFNGDDARCFSCSSELLLSFTNVSWSKLRNFLHIQSKKSHIYALLCST